MNKLTVTALALALAMLAANAHALSPATTIAPTATAAAKAAWKPLTPGTTWNWQLDGRTVNASVLDRSTNPKKMLDIDLDATPATTIAQLKAKGIYVVCYTEVGSYNSRRADEAEFRKVPGLIGKPMDGFEDEKWLDVRRTDALMPIMEKRLDIAKAKGCDGVEPDLDDSYTEDTGFELTIEDSLHYLGLLVDAAHARGMSMGLKNGPEMAVYAATFADWALNEECNEHDECGGYKEFIKRNKAVFQVEYRSNGTRVKDFCPQDNKANFDGLLKDASEELHALPRDACRNG
ncbi:endo alpha-1,4 polygalactosaminidase [Pseudomonas sp. CGJS7]|uniref:endo alpha-1,4 polygalactosaminidase n=1 Tax=Pseudomonas sp. CGJS7 TaxID=3109348 RepID=UPI003008E51E